MKFYEVRDEYGDYTAIIWAEDSKDSEQVYRENIESVQALIVGEVPVDEVYKRLVKAAETKPDQEYLDFGVMGMLRDIISSSAPAVVLTRGVD